MLRDIKKAIGNSAIYSFGNMGTKLIGLLLIPLYTNQDYLTVSDYGALGVLEITSMVLVSLMSLTLTRSLTRWYWDKEYVAKQKSIFFSSLVVLIFIGVISLSALLPLSGSFSRLLFASTSYAYIIKLLLVNAALQVLIGQVQTLLKLQSKALWHSLISILKLSVTLVLTIYFIVSKGKKLDGIFEAQLLGSLATVLLLIPYAVRNCSFRFERKIILEMINYGLPLMLASISGVFFSVIDRYSLNYLDGLDRVGVYNLGYKVASAVKIIVINSIQLALSPILVKKMNDRDNHHFYSRVMTYTGYVLMFCVIGLSLFSLELIKVASQDMVYWESVNIVAILSFSFFFGMLKDSAFIGLYVKKKTRITGGLLVVASLINLGLNLLLIPRFSIYGAAAGTLISNILFFVMVYHIAQKWYRIPYEIPRLLLVLISGVILVGAGFLSNGFSLGPRLVMKALLLVSFPFLLYLFRFYHQVELETIGKIFKAWKQPSKLVDNLKRLFNNK